MHEKRICREFPAYSGHSSPPRLQDRPDVRLHTVNVLYRLDYQMPEMRSQQSQRKAQQGIAGKMEEILFPEQGIIFMDEGREGRKASAETHREKKPQIAVHQIAPLEKSVQHADNQTSGDIDRQRPPRESRSGMTLHEPGEQIPRNTAGKTSGTDKKERLYHRACKMKTGTLRPLPHV